MANNVFEVKAYGGILTTQSGTVNVSATGVVTKATGSNFPTDGSWDHGLITINGSVYIVAPFGGTVDPANPDSATVLHVTTPIAGVPLTGVAYSITADNAFAVLDRNGVSLFTVTTAGSTTLAAAGTLTLNTIQADATHHLLLNTQEDDRAVRLNSRNYSTIGSGTALGFSSKPAQAVASTGTIQGGEVSPRVLSGIACANAIGLFADVELKGTAAGTISGDVRALNLELVTDDAGTRTISGNVNFIRLRAAFSATTISGTFVPIRIEKAEAQTNSKQYDAVLELPSTNGSIWGVKGSDYTPSEPRAKIKILVNGTAYWLVGYASEPT